MKNDCFTVCGEMATSVAPACSICGRMRFIASICPTQNGHQRPRMKQSTRRPLREQDGRKKRSCRRDQEVRNCGAFAPTRQDVCRKMLCFEFGDSLRVNRLRLRRNVLRDQLFALGKDLAQGASVETPTDSSRERHFILCPFKPDRVDAVEGE